MSSADYVAGLRAVEGLLAAPGVTLKRLYLEYRSANPRVAAVAEAARAAGVEIQSANRARLTQLSGSTRHQGVVALVRRTSRLDEPALRSMVEARLTEAPADDATPLAASAAGRRGGSAQSRRLPAQRGRCRRRCGRGAAARRRRPGNDGEQGGGGRRRTLAVCARKPSIESAGLVAGIRGPRGGNRR